MSVIPLKTDIHQCGLHVRLVPDMHLRWPLSPLAQPFLDDFELRVVPPRGSRKASAMKGLSRISEPRPAITERDTIPDEALPSLHLQALRGLQPCVDILAGARKNSR